MLNAIANSRGKKVSTHENACVTSYSVFSHLNIDHKEGSSSLPFLVWFHTALGNHYLLCKEVRVWSK